VEDDLEDEMPNDSTDQQAPEMAASGPIADRDEALHREALAEEAITPAESATPPALSGKAFLGRGFARWLVMGGVRVLYRRWTRLAVYLFPEDSRRAAFATRAGIPLPDSLNMSWITPHLAVGGRVHPADIARLAGTGITRVVDTRSEHQDDERALGASGIGLLCLPTPDTQPLTVAQLCEGARWINEQIAAGQRVLIHCEHGVGRSVLLTAAALVESGMSAREAITLIQRKRWQAAPNHRQMRRLQEFERAIHNGTGC
jgi:protein-tyrosine phosphatase